jgi:cyanophycin synthetase
MACSGGVYVNGTCALSGPFSGADGPIRAYRAGGRDLLVLETAHGGIQRYGFGFRGCDIAIFTNITDGHLGELGIETLGEMLALKWRLASRVRPGGTIVLNADDPLLSSLRPPRSVKVVYISLARDRVQGDADLRVPLYRYCDDGTVLKERAGSSSIVAEIPDAPLLCQGFAPYNAYNLLAAIASVEAMRPCLPVSQESLLGSLMSFGSVPDDNPGHFNLFEGSWGRVLLLAGSNRDSYQRDAQALARIRTSSPFSVGRIIGVITGIGMQSTSYIRELAGIVASVCDEIIIREPLPRYRHVRAPGEISSILKSAALESGIPHHAIHVWSETSDLIRDLILPNREANRFVAVFSAFAQEPIIDLCRRLGDLGSSSNRWS